MDGNYEREREREREREICLFINFFFYLPGMQTQRNVPGSSRHEPSFWQGCDSHSLTFVSHLGPVNPWVQLHLNEPGVFTQIPPCSHGDPTKLIDN